MAWDSGRVQIPTRIRGQTIPRLAIRTGTRPWISQSSQMIAILATYPMGPIQMGSAFRNAWTGNAVLIRYVERAAEPAMCTRCAISSGIVCAFRIARNGNVARIPYAGRVVVTAQHQIRAT